MSIKLPAIEQRTPHSIKQKQPAGKGQLSQSGALRGDSYLQSFRVLTNKDNVTASDLRKIYSTFKLYSVRKTRASKAYLDEQGVADALTGLGLAPDLAERAYYLLDEDNSGKMEMSEFIKGAYLVLKGTEEDRLSFTFELFDWPRREFLDYDQIEELSKFLYPHHSSSGLTDAETGKSRSLEANVLIRMLDKNIHGRVMKRDFIERCQSHPSLVVTIAAKVFGAGLFEERNDKDLEPPTPHHTNLKFPPIASGTSTSLDFDLRRTRSEPHVKRSHHEL